MVPESSPADETALPADAEAGSPALELDGSGRKVTSLSRELADFLIEFSIVLHKRSMYPAGHPHLRDSAERFARRLNALLGTRDAVTLGVALNRLVIESVTTDPKNALLRDLAHRLHRHRIAVVHLTRGATGDEIEDVLGALSADPQRGEGPLGKRLHQVGPWNHIQLRPVGYDRLALQDGDTAGRGPMSGRDAWVELARLALSTDTAGESLTEANPLVVAQAIGRKSGEVAYDRVVLGYLSRVAEEMSGR
ncbi:MAG: HEAT-like repeat-containing protein, partial [Geminicoccaceae bacterium]|nr:HEAT-like repeat-containing protein [Geminicoccaceae bacterium]